MRALALLAVLVLALAACSGDDGPDAGTGTGSTTEAAPGTTTEPDATTTEPDGTTTEPGDTTTEGEFPRPGPILTRFIRAAAAEDLRTMWELLSVPSRRRLGPTFEEFRARRGPGLARQVGVFVRGSSRVFLEEPITSLFAVAAYGGRTRVGTGQPFGTYAAAFRREDAGWRLELGGPVQLAPLGPDPGQVTRGTFQLAASVEANAAVNEAGMWLDGTSVPGRTAGAGDARRVTMFGDSPRRVPRGPHAVVAFAATFADASALAWMFTHRSRGESADR